MLQALGQPGTFQHCTCRAQFPYLCRVGMRSAAGPASVQLRPEELTTM